MKKGSSHVDWAISMGLFIVFVMLALIFLKPGTEPIYQGDTLLKIVRTQLETNSQYFVEKQLLSINSLTDCTSTNCKLRIRQASKYGLNPDWVSGKIRRMYTAIINDTQTKYDQKGITFDVRNDYCDEPNCNYPDPKKSECSSYYFGCGNTYVLDINAPLTTGENTFYILNSNNFTYDTYIEEGVNIDMKDKPSVPKDKPPASNDWCSNCILDTNPSINPTTYDFTYKFGVAERQIGFSEEKLRVLKNEDYERLKDSWKIPDDKNFRVKITNLTTCTPSSYRMLTYDECLNLFNGYLIAEQIPQQTNVFTEEWKSEVLTPEGELIPVKVNVEIW